MGSEERIDARRAAAVLGAGALLAVVLCLAVRVPVTEEAGLTWYRDAAYHGILLGIAGAAVARVVGGLRAPGFVGRSEVWTAVGAAAALLGILLSALGLSIVYGTEPGLAHYGYCLVFGVLEGMGLGALTCRWAEEFPCATAASAVRGMAGAMLVGSVLWIAATLLPQGVAVSVLEAALVVASSVCLARVSGGAGRDLHAAVLTPESFAAFFGRRWIPLASLALCALIGGLTYNAYVSETALHTSVGSALYGLAAVAVSAALVVGVTVSTAAGAFERTFGLSAGNAAFPLALAVVMVTPLLQIMANAGEAFAAVCDAFSLAAFVVLTVLSCALFLVDAGKEGIDCGLVAAAVLLACALVAEVGFISIAFLGSGGRMVCLLLQAALIAALAVWYARGGRFSVAPAMQAAAEGPAVEVEEAPTSLESDFEKRCNGLAQRCSLSPREREVLGFLGRGYGSGYIAEALGISENTARTHVRHIYEKLGVGSREALIDLLR